jgi:hypothetical protein
VIYACQIVENKLLLSLKNNFFVLQMTGVNESLDLIILFSAYIGFL